MKQQRRRYIAYKPQDVYKLNVSDLTAKIPKGTDYARFRWERLRFSKTVRMRSVVTGIRYWWNCVSYNPGRWERCNRRPRWTNL